MLKQESRRIRRCRDYLAPLLLGVAIVGFTPISQAQDNLDPIFESLPYLQKVAARRAAPSGMDAPPPEPAQPHSVSFTAPAPVASELEKSAEQRGGELTLVQASRTQEITGTLQQYGYDLFNSVPTTFAPLTNIPVPPNYRIAAGDTLIVQLYGKRNVEYRLVVTREGRLLIPEYGPLEVSGLTFTEVKDLISRSFEQRVIGARAVVTMGDLRTLQVRLTGDVSRPGVYTVGALSTLVDALTVTGGIKYTGSMRDIQLKRSGKLITSLDLYDLLLEGDSSADMVIRHNDVIFVPPIGDTVYVGGEIQRPAIYELRDEDTVGKVLELAGGLTASASLPDSFIERVIPGRYRTLVSLAGPDPATQSVRGGDYLRVLPVDDTLDAVVMLSGHVKRPGAYQLTEGMRLSDLVPDRRMLLPNADLDFALIKREEPGSGRTQVVYVDLSAGMGDRTRSQNIFLQARDELIILNLAADRAGELAMLVRELDIQATDYRIPATLTLVGNLRFTGRMPLQGELSLLEALAIGGGIRSGTDMQYSVVARSLHPSGNVVMRSFSLAAAMRDPEGRDNPTILAGDRVYVFDSSGDRSELMQADLALVEAQGAYQDLRQIVWANGRVNHPGRYPLEPGMRASDLLCAARGLVENAYGVSAELSRYESGLDARRQVEHWALDIQHLLRLCQGRTQSRMEPRGEGGFESRDAFSLGRPGPVRDRAALDALYRDDNLNPLLAPDDQLTFVDQPGWVGNFRVTLTGELERPGLYVVDRGETLCAVLLRAGGVTAAAYLPGAVFTRESIRVQQQRTLAAIQAQLDDLLVNLSLSHSYNNADKVPGNEQKSEYLQVIRQLDKAEPEGRMVIDLEKAMSCDGDFNIALEDGDSLRVGVKPGSVYVAGQVYVPTSHQYQSQRTAADYLELSGGATVLGREKHAYVIGPNGEVLAGNSRRGARALMRSRLQPGSTLVVPLDVDRMNGTEKAQSWTRMFAEVAILAGIIL